MSKGKTGWTPRTPRMLRIGEVEFDNVKQAAAHLLIEENVIYSRMKSTSPTFADYVWLDDEGDPVPKQIVENIRETKIPTSQLQLERQQLHLTLSQLERTRPDCLRDHYAPLFGFLHRRPQEV